MNEPVSLPVFYLMYAKTMGWVVPEFHIRVCEWLDSYGSFGLLMLPRGHGKSTILEVYNAYRIHKDRNHLMLHQGATDSDAYKISRGTSAVLEKHPLTRKNCVRTKGEVQKWWVNGCEDVKHGNIHARGILSNVTGSRACEIINDDAETPSTTSSQELRDKLSYRLSEQVHILIPGGQRLFVGTPHNHDSLYTKVQDSGANCIILKMFSDEKRLLSSEAAYTSFRPITIFAGIGSHARLLEEGLDYTVTPETDRYLITFTGKTSYNLIDIYGKALWEDRFTPTVMLQRRRECSALNEWDSQYQLHSVPLSANALDIDKFIPYTGDIKYTKSNNQLTCSLNDIPMVSVIACFDPSSGKAGRDVSALSVVFKDQAGKLYWQDCVKLEGELATTDKDGRITGGQVSILCDYIEKYKLPNIHIETNGIGGHIPSVLKAALKTRRLSCGVTEIHVTTNKNKRIMNIQSLLLSNALYVNKNVLDNKDVVKQINNFNPLTTKNKDDYLDSLATCILNTPTTLGYIDIHNQTNSFNTQFSRQAVVAEAW